MKDLLKEYNCNKHNDNKGNDKLAVNPQYK